MKQILCLLFCLPLLVEAQVGLALNDAIQKGKASQTSGGIVIRCVGTTMPASPLFVVDGEVIEEKYIRDIDPFNIDSIHILKKATSTALWGTGGAAGAILITTKNHKPGKLSILSTNNQSSIPFAEVMLVSLDNRQDTTRKMADEKGMVNLQDIKAFRQYRVMVTAFGYETFEGNITAVAGKDIEIKLRPEYREMAGVILTSGCQIRCGRYGRCGDVLRCTIQTVHIQEEAKTLITSSRVFPNPVRSGSGITCELEMAEKSLVNLQLMSLSGQVLYRQSISLVEGRQRINISTNISWAKGMYLLSVYSGNQLLKQDKIMLE